MLDKEPLLSKGFVVFTFIEHPTYTKGGITDMSSEQKKRLAKAVEQIKAEHQK
jgi:hypothetical protein